MHNIIVSLSVGSRPNPTFHPLAKLIPNSEQLSKCRERSWPFRQVVVNSELISFGHYMPSFKGRWREKSRFFATKGSCCEATFHQRWNCNKLIVWNLYIQELSALQLKLCFNDAPSLASRTTHHPTNYSLILYIQHAWSFILKSKKQGGPPAFEGRHLTHQLCSYIFIPHSTFHIPNSVFRISHYISDIQASLRDIFYFIKSDMFRYAQRDMI